MSSVNLIYLMRMTFCTGVLSLALLPVSCRTTEHESPTKDMDTLSDNLETWVIKDRLLIYSDLQRLEDSDGSGFSGVMDLGVKDTDSSKFDEFRTSASYPWDGQPRKVYFESGSLGLTLVDDQSVVNSYRSKYRYADFVFVSKLEPCGTLERSLGYTGGGLINPVKSSHNCLLTLMLPGGYLPLDETTFTAELKEINSGGVAPPTSVECLMKHEDYLLPLERTLPLKQGNDETSDFTDRIDDTWYHNLSVSSTATGWTLQVLVEGETDTIAELNCLISNTGVITKTSGGLCEEKALDDKINVTCTVE